MTKSKRDRVKEVLEVRTRRGRNSQSHYLNRVTDLKLLLEQGNLKEGELYRYFPVAIVTTLEVFFRSWIKEIIDLGTPFSARSETLATYLRFDFGIIHSLHGKTITLGELIAHSVPLSSLNDINSHFSCLLDKDFLANIKTVKSRLWLGRDKDDDCVPIMADAPGAFETIESIFQTRHIVVHEVPEHFKLELGTVNQFLDHSIYFLEAADELISQTVYPNQPRTQAEATQRADEEYEKQLRRITDAVNNLITKLDEQAAKELEVAQKSWDGYCRADAAFYSSQAQGGTMQPMLWALRAEEVAKQRADFLEEFLAEWEQVRT